MQKCGYTNIIINTNMHADLKCLHALKHSFGMQYFTFHAKKLLEMKRDIVFLKPL